MGTLANGIKDIFSTSQTTATHLPVCASDGTPQGRISVGNLASVLGVQCKSFTSGDDLNNFKTEGWWYTESSTIGRSLLHKPSGIDIGNFLMHTKVSTSATQIRQYFYVGGNLIYMRGFYSTSWSDWSEISTNIPSFYKNYQDLNSLGTSLLQAFGYETKQLLNQGDSVSFNRGYGFLFVTSIAMGHTYCFIVNASTPIPLAENPADYSAMLTFTKSSEQAFTITAAQRVNGQVIFIHG